LCLFKQVWVWFHSLNNTDHIIALLGPLTVIFTKLNNIYFGAMWAFQNKNMPVLQTKAHLIIFVVVRSSQSCLQYVHPQSICISDVSDMIRQLQSYVWFHERVRYNGLSPLQKITHKTAKHVNPYFSFQQWLIIMYTTRNNITIYNMMITGPITQSRCGQYIYLQLHIILFATDS
jgi:hypothetical protein